MLCADSATTLRSELQTTLAQTAPVGIAALCEAHGLDMSAVKKLKINPRLDVFPAERIKVNAAILELFNDKHVDAIRAQCTMGDPMAALANAIHSALHPVSSPSGGDNGNAGNGAAPSANASATETTRAPMLHTLGCHVASLEASEVTKDEIHCYVLRSLLAQVQRHFSELPHTFKAAERQRLALKEIPDASGKVSKLMLVRTSDGDGEPIKIPFWGTVVEEQAGIHAAKNTSVHIGGNIVSLVLDGTKWANPWKSDCCFAYLVPVVPVAAALQEPTSAAIVSSDAVAVEPPPSKKKKVASKPQPTATFKAISEDVEFTDLLGGKHVFQQPFLVLLDEDAPLPATEEQLYRLATEWDAKKPHKKAKLAMERKGFM